VCARACPAGDVLSSFIGGAAWGKPGACQVFERCSLHMRVVQGAYGLRVGHEGQLSSQHRVAHAFWWKWHPWVLLWWKCILVEVAPLGAAYQRQEWCTKSACSHNGART